MATTVTPAIPAAPAAPAAPAPSAPAPAPAPAPSPAPAPPAPPAAPASTEGSGAANQPPAAPAAPAAPSGPPKASDFAQSAEGIEQFIDASEQWKQEHPDQAAQAVEEQQQAAPLAPEAGTQPDDQAKPAEEQPKPPAAAEAQPLPTPQAFDELLSAKPDFKALFDRDPEAKSQVMGLARAAEAAKPVLDIVPTVEEAKFAVGHANQFLNLQHMFAMAAENPEMGERGFEQFLDLFKVRDDKGQPIVQNGVPQMAESFDFLTRKLTSGALTDRIEQQKQTLAALKGKLESGVYPSEQTKEADRVASVDADYSLKALEYVSELLGAAEPELALPELPQDATQAQRELQAELKKQLEQVTAGKQQNSKAARVQARQTFERKMNGSFGQIFGDFVDAEIKSRRDRGEYIPDFVLTQKWINPATNQVTTVPTYAAQTWHAFQAKIHSIPSIAQKLRDLELQGVPGEQARMAYFTDLIGKQPFAKKIVDDYLTEIQNGIRQGVGERQAQQQRVAQVARVEPQTAGGTPGAPQPLSGQALMDQARENLKTNPEYTAAGRVERAELEMVEAERIRSGRR
jgi:hypothetical protein